MKFSKWKFFLFYSSRTYIYTYIWQLLTQKKSSVFLSYLSLSFYSNIHEINTEVKKFPIIKAVVVVPKTIYTIRRLMLKKSLLCRDLLIVAVTDSTVYQHQSKPKIFLSLLFVFSHLFFVIFYLWMISQLLLIDCININQYMSIN